MALCVFIYIFPYILGSFFQKFLHAGLWIEILLGEIRKLKIMKAMYSQEKQDTTGNTKFKSIQWNFKMILNI